MSGALAAAILAAAAFTAIVVYQLQLRLEVWDYDRHADD